MDGTGCGNIQRAIKKEHEHIECNLTKFQQFLIVVLSLFKNEAGTLSQSSTKITLLVTVEI